MAMPEQIMIERSPSVPVETRTRFHFAVSESRFSIIADSCWAGNCAPTPHGPHAIISVSSANYGSKRLSVFDHIQIEGFRSFKRVDLDLPPLSILIGPNGGGKSNLLDVLMLLAEAGNGQLAIGLNRRGGFRNIAFGFDSSQEVRVELRLKKALKVLTAGVLINGQVSPPPAPSVSEIPERKALDMRYEVGLRARGLVTAVWKERLVVESPSDAFSLTLVKRDATGTAFRWSRGPDANTEERKQVEENELAIFQVRDATKYPEAAAVLQVLQGWSFYRDIDVGPESPVRQPTLVTPGAQLSPDGGNLSSVLFGIQQDHPDTWDEILEICRTAYPDFAKITVRAEGGDGKIVLRWWERPHEKEGLSANLLSDGTLKFLCLIAILVSPDPPPLICIDEPEIGLHPDWIELVAELMQAAASRTQLIVATHSPQIVARLDAEQVIVTEKENGETRLKRLQRQELGKWLNEFNLSDLWLAGHFGGRP
jgi:predicted ATPase